MSNASTRLPLSGIRVIDLGRAVAAPFCGQMLADMGAEVIKVERPGRGDETRHLRPMPKAVDGTEIAQGGFNFIASNRNKKSITLDISSTRGQEILRALAGTADVLLENYKVGDLARHGLDYPGIKAVNPRIIYCSVTGYGQTGPYADRPGYDSVFQAQSGLMSLTGTPDGPPMRVGYYAADINSGMVAVSSILGALYYRDANNGCGQHIDVALLDSQVAAMGSKVQTYLLSGKVPSRFGNRNPGGAPAQAVRCADGNLLQVSATDDVQFSKFSQAIGHPELASDERFSSAKARIANEPALDSILTGIFVQRPVEAWVEILEKHGIIHGRINDIGQMLSDPQVRHRGLVVDVEHPQAGTVQLLRSPIRYSETPLDTYAAPPSLGQHNEEIYSRLGISKDEMASLREQGVI